MTQSGRLAFSIFLRFMEASMNDKNISNTEVNEQSSRGFLATILQDLAQDSLRFLIRAIIAFSIGTGAGAIVCWYYNIPLVFSLIGGVLVLGLVLFLSMAHLID